MPINLKTFLVSLTCLNLALRPFHLRLTPSTLHSRYVPDGTIECNVLGITCLDGYSQKSAQTIMPRISREQHCRYRNINLLSIAYATRLGLGPTNPGTIIVAQETLLLRWAGFSPALKLLIPAFSLPRAPPGLPARLHCTRNAPLPLSNKLDNSHLRYSA